MEEKQVFNHKNFYTSATRRTQTESPKNRSPRQIEEEKDILTLKKCQNTIVHRIDTMCTHQKSCMKEVTVSFWYNFLRGCAIKLILRLITERQFKSIAKNYHDIPKFGVIIGLFSGLFKLTKCLLNRYCQDMHPRLKSFIAGIVCSFSLQLATQGEQSVLKLLLYPRVIESIFQFLCEKGIITKFKHGDILAYALQVIIITYSYMFEPDNMTKGFSKTIDNYCVGEIGDARALISKQAVARANLHRRYSP